MIKITINQVEIEVNEASTILDACNKLGVEIPTFCHDKRLVPAGACRMCVVDVKGARNLMAACSTPVADGMIIETHTEEVENARKDILELLWASHDNDCLICEQAGNCKLQDYCYQYDIAPEQTYFKLSQPYQKDDSNPFYIFDRNKCILCGKCVRVCDQLQGTTAIGLSERGFHTHIAHPFDLGMTLSDCVSCGNCVNVCPTGALTEKKKQKFRYWDVDRTVKTTCGYCGVGCQLEMKVIDNKIVEIMPSETGINEGLLCVKGKFAYEFVGHPERLTTPLIKKDNVFVEASWEQALDLIAKRLGSIKADYGPDAIGALASARCTTEDNYMMQKFFRAVIGTNSIDHCARL